MSTYYYFAASLPLLEFGVKPAMTHASFMDNCGRLLPEKDFKVIKDATIGPQEVFPSGNRTLFAWSEFNRNLRNELAMFRSKRAGRNPSDHTRGEAYAEPQLTELVVQASKARDPLSAEKTLDTYKWNYLDELSQGHFFDLDFLIVYSLKLQVIERYQNIEISKGHEVLDRYKGMVPQPEESFS